MPAPATLRRAHTPGAIVFHHAALRAVRRAARLSLADAADAVGRDASIIARYERGEVAPSVDVLAALCAAYGADPANLWHRRPA